MTLREIEWRLKELLSTPTGKIVLSNGNFIISTINTSDVIVCGIGSTLQLAIFNYDERAKKVRKP